jgi:hypothetical protein
MWEGLAGERVHQNLPPYKNPVGKNVGAKESYRLCEKIQKEKRGDEGKEYLTTRLDIQNPPSLTRRKKPSPNSAVAAFNSRAFF